MTSNIMDDDKVVTVGLPAWHKLGQNFQLPISAEDAHTSMGGSFTLCKKQVGVMFDKSFVKIPNSYAIVRGPTNKDATSKVFGYATDHYHLIQPIEIIKKFDEKVGIGIETLGFIEDGKKCFLTWKLPEFDVSDGDEVKLYGILMLGFDTIFSSRLNVGTVRVVCANTFAAALGEEKEEMKKNRGRGTVYSSKHTNTNMLNELGEWMGCIQQNAEKQVELLQSFFRKLDQTKVVHEQQAKDLIYTAWPNPEPIPDLYPDALRHDKQEKIDMETERLTEQRDGIMRLFNGAGTAIDATYWGLFNSATQYFNYEQKSKKDTAYSIVWGNRNNHMNHFADVLRKDIYG